MLDTQLRAQISKNGRYPVYHCRDCPGDHIPGYRNAIRRVGCVEISWPSHPAVMTSLSCGRLLKQLMYSPAATL